MAFFTWSLTLATGISGNPLDVSGSSWKYQYVPFDCVVEIIHRTTVVSVTCQITSGSDEVQQRSPVSAGGTAGVITGRLNVEPVTFKAAKGDLIQINYTNGNAGSATIDGSIELTPLGGLK